MAAYRPDMSMTALLPPLGGATTGLAVALAALLMPIELLEAVVRHSGIAALIPLAAPPLGHTARAGAALGGGLATGAILWSVLYLLWGQGGVLTGRTIATADAPSVRRADTHPDAPPRRPLSAADIGQPTPPPAPAIEQPLPADLDQPLAAFDPAALPAVPLAPTPSLPPLAPPVALGSGERIETFDLSPRPPCDTQPSIEQLLRRLEQNARGPLRAG